jgi:tRNA (guanine-N7-)-methyltransferase
MRMRRKKNLDTRLQNVADILIRDPHAHRGCWGEISGGRPVLLEIGCGKGRFACDMSKSNQEIFYIGVEKDPNVIVMAAERAVGEGIENIRFMNADAGRLNEYFTKGEVSGIYINFCDPWPAERYRGRRLTSEEYLKSYANILDEEGAVEFKTDDEALFQFSLAEFSDCGWLLENMSRDLHGGGYDGILTEYEERFVNMGKKINYLTARKPLGGGEESVKLEFLPVTTLNDISDVVKLGERIWHEHYASLLGHGQIVYMLEKFQSMAAITAQIEEGYVYEILAADGKKAGYIGLRPEGDRLYLSKVYLDRSFRGRGLGRAMIERAFYHAEGLKAVYLTVNKGNSGSVAVYKKMGFEIADSVVSDIGGGYVMDDYIMEYKL